MSTKTSKSEIEAQKLLDVVGITSPPIPLERIAEHLGLELVPSNFDEDEVCGILVVDEAVDNAVGIIGYNRAHHSNRQRFSIAHEIGHFVLHVKNKSVEGRQNLFIDKAKNFTAAFFRDAESSTGENAWEVEANAFAASLLMPQTMLEKAIGNDTVSVVDDDYIQQLAKLFSVSSITMQYRLLNLFR